MRINFTESTLTTLKRTANCSYANAVYKLTMKAQQGLKCDDIYKKSVLMHEVNKLLCKYKLDTCISFYDSEECTLYTEEQLNCITPDNLQVLYEFTHKYKETAAKSSRRATTPSSTTSSSTSDCCTWGSIGGSIGNQSDLVNYLATVEKNMISVKDEGTEITADVKSINFVGSGVTAASVNGNVTVTIPGGGGSGSTYTVDNGLTESPANNFQLGGILIQNTTIDTDTNELLITTSTSPSAPLAVENLNSDDSTDVDGIDVYSEVGVAGVFEINHYSDSNIFPVLELKRNSSTSSRNYDGLGGAIDFYLRKNDGTYTGYPTARIAAKWLASTTTDSQIELWAHSNGLQKRIATFNIDTTPRSGQINFEEYGLGNFAVNNPDYLLAVNGAGDIVESENVVKTFKRIITSAELASAGANQIIAAPGAGKAINVIEASIKLDYNGIAYTPVFAGIATTGGGLFGIPTSFFTATSNKFAKMYDINTYQYADGTTYLSNLVENSPINFTVTTPSSVGNSTITIYGSYRIITL